MKNSAAKKRKQVPVGYLVIGVDPHKKKHAAVVMTQDFTTHSRFKFDNSREGFEMVLERTKALMLKTGCRGVIFAIETGAHYWRNLAYFLDEKGIPLRLINQFTLKRRREGKDLNHRKNDYRDSEVAAQLLCTCAMPSTIAGMTEAEFVDAIKAAHQGRIMKGKLQALHHIARTSIGIEAGAQSVSSEIAFLVEKRRLLEQQLRHMNETLARLVHETREGKYLLSIIGLSHISVAGIIAELGPFSSYQNAKQLIKMAGSNPTESESGGKRRSHTPISKQGRPVLRHCAWTAVIPMLRFNPDFRDWAKKLRERPASSNPLSGREVMVAAVNKLLRLAFALVKKQTFYLISVPQPAKL